MHLVPLVPLVRYHWCLLWPWFLVGAPTILEAHLRHQWHRGHQRHQWHQGHFSSYNNIIRKYVYYTIYTVRKCWLCVFCDSYMKYQPKLASLCLNHLARSTSICFTFGVFKFWYYDNYPCIHPFVYFLQKLSSGDLLLSVRCTTNHHKLQGIILKAVNLPRPHKWGSAGKVDLFLAGDHTSLWHIYKMIACTHVICTRACVIIRTSRKTSFPFCHYV